MAYKEETLETLGDWNVVGWAGRNYLNLRDKRIAECVCGDYDERFGGILGWIKHIEKQKVKRSNKILDQINALKEERKEIEAVIFACWDEIKK